MKKRLERGTLTKAIELFKQRHNIDISKMAFRMRLKRHNPEAIECLADTIKARKEKTANAIKKLKEATELKV